MTGLSWMDVAGDHDAASDGSDAVSEEALLEGLNPSQRRAVTHGDGPLLILAGAGSGKTRVITRRIAWLAARGGVGLDGICAITFTNKAAREMRERVEALLPTRGSWISTFHAMCARILRRDVETLRFEDGTAYTRDFSIYDTADRNALIKRIVKDLGYDTTRFRPAQVGAWISEQKNVSRDSGYEDGVEGMEHEVLRRVGERYQATLRAANAVDFDDLLLLVLQLFDRHPGVRDSYSTRFRHVLVDEYQDTNHVQYLLTRHLASAHGNLAVCGDPDQSIYAWRGADIRNILDFERDFPGAEVVRLEQNYRSTQAILDAAQAVIRHNSQRKEKELYTEGEQGEPLELLECGDENEEADQIALRVAKLRAEGASYGDMAVFYRVNFMQRALERGLRLAGVPYRIAGGVEFYQRKEIKDLVSYLKLMVNPDDDVAFLRVVNEPARGIGDRSLEILSGWAADRRVSLLRAAGSEEARSGIRGRAKKGLEAFAGLMERLRDVVGSGGADGAGSGRSASEALEALLEETDYLTYLAQSSDENAETREENVDEFRANAETYDADYPDGGLRGFLEDIALVSEVDSLTAEGEESPEGRVTLMTVHAAKGLEFPIVFLPGLEEELFPHFRAVMDEHGAGLEEERRLMYVGLTRAMRRLFLSWARTRTHFGQSSWREASRFLKELPDSVTAIDEPDDVDLLGDYDGSASGAGLNEGDWVAHEHFGRGVVERLRGSGVNARATVRFPHAGTKTLLLQYAKLTKVGAGS